MALLALGINHKTAPVALREKVSFSPDRALAALKDLVSASHAEEAVILSTCNRTELYCQLEQEDCEPIIRWLQQYHGLGDDEIRPNLYTYYDEHAVAHLMRVASGLDSLVLGEPQILGQIKQAYNHAKQANTVAQTLERLFQKSFSVAKRVRTETEIGVSAVSVAFAAVSMAKHIFDDLSKANVLLIGAGETIELAARHFHDRGVSQMMVANRTAERAKNLASQFDAIPYTLTNIPELLEQADIVVSSTAAPLPVVGKGMVESALKARRHKPMLLVDIAVPRDIEGEVGELEDAYLYTVDDLQGIIEQNKEARQQAAVKAEQIVRYERQQFMSWLRSLEAVDSIREYRQWAESEKQENLERALLALENGGDPQAVMQELAHRLTNKLIHKPTLALNEAGKSSNMSELNRIRDILGLED